MVTRLFRDTPRGSMEPKSGRSISILDTDFFARIINDEIDFDNIQRNIDRNLLDAITVTATDVHDGRTTVFVQAERSKLPPWTRDPRRVARAGKMSAEKVLASAAIPMLFPSVNVEGRWYFDGGLRQNTPLSPALRMGATKVLTVGLMTNPQKRFVHEVSDDFHTPTVTFLLGKLLNALLLDPLDYDLAMLERINGLLKYGAEAAGNDDFLDRLNDVIETYRGQPYRPVDSLLIRPTQDLGKLAGEYAASLSNEEWGNPVLATLGRRIATADGPREADFLSYVLFDGGYTGRLLDLGYEDARVKHRQLVRFFAED
jgi:NTE family protein